MERKEYLKSITKEAPIKYCCYCGKKLERKRYRGTLEDMGCFLRRKYCGRDCMKKNFISNDKTNQLYTPAHHTAREQVYVKEMRERVCSVCGSTRNVDVHHKDGNYNNNSSDNLVLLCRSCHMKEHRKRNVCVICGKPVKGHGYCNKHYLRWKKYGDPLILRNKETDI